MPSAVEQRVAVAKNVAFELSPLTARRPFSSWPEVERRVSVEERDEQAARSCQTSRRELD